MAMGRPGHGSVRHDCAKVTFSLRFAAFRPWLILDKVSIPLLSEDLAYILGNFA